MFLFYIVKVSRPVIQSLIAKRVKYVNRNALSMFKLLNKCFKYKCAVFTLYHVEG